MQDLCERCLGRMSCSIPTTKHPLQDQDLFKGNLCRSCARPLGRICSRSSAKLWVFTGCLRKLLLANLCTESLRGSARDLLKGSSLQRASAKYLRRVCTRSGSLRKISGYGLSARFVHRIHEMTIRIPFLCSTSVGSVFVQDHLGGKIVQVLRRSSLKALRKISLEGCVT